MDLPDPAPVATDSMVGKALRLLTAFRPGDQDVSLAELHRRTGIAKPTAHRLLGELRRWQVVESGPRGYRLGMRLFELGQRVPHQRDLRDAAAPFLADLFEATHETVHLAVLEGVEVVYVQKIDGRRGPEIPSRVGGRMPAYCTGVGKVLLAHAPPERLAEVIAAGLLPRARRTITMPGRLAADLASIRERGVATEFEESAPGLCCVAAPVLGSDGHAVAAVSITGWITRLDPARFGPAVRTAALGIARRVQAADGEPGADLLERVGAGQQIGVAPSSRPGTATP